MNKVYGQTLLDDMVRSQSLPMHLVKQAATEILAIIREGLVSDGVVNVSNFGTFRLKPVAARRGFNPQTREPITIPAHHRVIFSPCKALRELIQPVHHPVVPIKPEESTTNRIAARSAAIAPVTPVASKRILPVEPASNVEMERPATSATIETEPQSPLASETTQTSTVPKVESETLAEVDIESDTTVGTETVAATTPNPITDQPKHDNEVPADDIVLDMRDAIKNDAAQPGSKNKAYIGAAALIVIATVTASLLLDNGSDLESTSATNSVAPSTNSPVTVITQIETVTPVTSPSEVTLPTSETATERFDAAPPAPLEAATSGGEVITATETPATVSEGVEQEIDSSSLYTEVNTATPIEEKPTNSESATPGSVESTTATTSATTVNTTLQTSGFFFTEQAHKIANGSSLWRLAREHYKNPLLWPHIYQANAAIIDNPDNLRAGTTIILPSLQGTPDKLTRTDRRNIAKGYYLTYLHYRLNGHKDAFFALLEAKRYDNKVVEEHSDLLKLSKVETVMLGQQETMPF